MKHRSIDLLLSLFIVFFISTLFVCVLIALNTLFRVPSIVIFAVWMFGSLVFGYILIVVPVRVLLLGYLEVRGPEDFVECFSKYLRKYESEYAQTPFSIHIVEDAGYCAMIAADIRKTRYILTSQLVNDWNEIDIECTVLYLLEVQRNNFLLRDTGILVLASIAERFIITSFVGAVLMHHIRSHRHDVHYDQQVVAKMQFTQGYQNMLTKYRDGMSFVSKLPGAFGMNAIGDVAKRGLHKALFEVHDSLDVRIDSVRNYANP